MEWITIKEAAIKTGKGERTIHRWIDANKSKPYFVKKQGKLTMVNASELAQFYPFHDVSHKSENVSQDEKTYQMQIVSHSETIKELSDHIKQKDKQLEFLLTKKSKLPIWLTIGFTMVVLILVYGLYVAFNAYKRELIITQEKEKAQLQLNASSNLKQTRSFYTFQIEEIREINTQQKQTITQQRQELAEKDRLISELYNDTKAQNEKLLELTKSHTTRQFL